MQISPPKHATASYRLQMHTHLTFETIRVELIDYLFDLGIDTVYLSPVFQATQGSTHGYDIVDHSRLDESLGTEDDFKILAEAIRARGMGLMLDIVPNHMGIDDARNRWWYDVLENGPCSPYAKYFDIDWSPPMRALHGKVLFPFLEDQFGRVLEKGLLRVAYENQTFVVRYHDRGLPTDPRSWVSVLANVRARLIHHDDWKVVLHERLNELIAGLERLPDRTPSDEETAKRRWVEKTLSKERLTSLLDASPEMRQALDDALTELNGRPDDPRSFDGLEAFLDAQAYRLCYWRVATDEINYRRFFDVDSLAAIRVEEPAVFDAVHATLIGYVANGWVTGLRVDHADGLFDPKQYLSLLSKRADTAARAADPANPDARVYLCAEKIIAHDETIPDDWPIAGTTGYDFLNLLNGLFVDRQGMVELRDWYFEFVENFDRFDDIVYEAKRTILSTSLASELNVLSNRLAEIAEWDRRSRDFTAVALQRALLEVFACFPVYRTYSRPESSEPGAEDRRRIEFAVRSAKRRNPAISGAFFDFIGSVLLLEQIPNENEQVRAARRLFAMRFQQISGPVTAKGFEDTALYRYYPLASLNEVGGHPAHPPATLDRFHAEMTRRATERPFDMNATATHDTKRGEGVRARLNVLAEIPDVWIQTVERWYELNADSRTAYDGVAVPSKNEEYLIYQTIVGIYPQGALANGAARGEFAERIVRYCEKAFREAKVNTSWLNPDAVYEKQCAAFIRSILEDDRSSFSQDLSRFVSQIEDAGYLKALSQTLLKICLPGIPDFYQGTEFWDLHLVDPDNRGRIDFAPRRAAIAELTAAEQRGETRNTMQRLLRAWPDRRLKAAMIRRALDCRKHHAGPFQGDYIPLEVQGPFAERVIAFARRCDREWVICVVPRLTLDNRKPGFNDSETIPSFTDEMRQSTRVILPDDAPKNWRHVVTDYPMTCSADEVSCFSLGELFREFPVTMLYGVQAESSPIPDSCKMP